VDFWLLVAGNSSQVAGDPTKRQPFASRKPQATSGKQPVAIAEVVGAAQSGEKS
jgi:hypothetical protein